METEKLGTGLFCFLKKCGVIFQNWKTKRNSVRENICFGCIQPVYSICSVDFRYCKVLVLQDARFLLPLVRSNIVSLFFHLLRCVCFFTVMSVFLNRLQEDSYPSRVHILCPVRHCCLWDFFSLRISSSHLDSFPYIQSVWPLPWK